MPGVGSRWPLRHRQYPACFYDWSTINLLPSAEAGRPPRFHTCELPGGIAADGQQDDTHRAVVLDVGIVLMGTFPPPGSCGCTSCVGKEIVRWAPSCRSDRIQAGRVDKACPQKKHPLDLEEPRLWRGRVEVIAPDVSEDEEPRKPVEPWTHGRKTGRAHPAAHVCQVKEEPCSGRYSFSIKTATVPGALTPKALHIPSPMVSFPAKRVSATLGTARELHER
jgi:hypothetical protein